MGSKKRTKTHKKTLTCKLVQNDTIIFLNGYKRTHWGSNSFKLQWLFYLGRLFLQHVNYDEVGEEYALSDFHKSLVNVNYCNSVYLAASRS